MHCTSTEDLRIFWPSYRHWSWYHITVCQVNTATHAVHWVTQIIWFRKITIPKTKMKNKHFNFYCGIVWYQLLFITTISFIIFTIYYKLQNAQWSDQYSVHKINPDIHLMCELHVTGKLYRAACSMSDADWHFFLNQ
jgi:hypothetical protein